MKLEIVNVVATTDLKQPVNLVDVSLIPYTIHDPNIYGGRVAYLSTPKMNGKATIFASGKLISVGTKSPEQAQKDIEITVKTLAKVGLVKKVSVKAKIRNIVAVYHIEKSIDLETLSIELDGIYEPEQFPGLILRQDLPKVTYLIFSSGKVVIAGSKSLKELQMAAEMIEKIVQQSEE